MINEENDPLLVGDIHEKERHKAGVLNKERGGRGRSASGKLLSGAGASKVQTHCHQRESTQTQSSMGFQDVEQKNSILTQNSHDLNQTYVHGDGDESESESDSDSDDDEDDESDLSGSESEGEEALTPAAGRAGAAPAGANIDYGSAVQMH